MKDLRSRSEIPVVIFSYLNPVLRYGFEKFTADAAAGGADGALLTDLNVDEAGPYLEEMRRHELDPIFLVSQTTRDDRPQTARAIIEWFRLSCFKGRCHG